MSVVPLRTNTTIPKPVIEYLDFTELHGVIDQNPHRDLLENPLTQPQIDRLVRSMKSTGFWDNLSVRPHPEKPGRYQLASGHARIAAARLAGYDAAHFVIHDFDDGQMLRMMVNENVTQFGKDSFKTYKEATIAAADIIMRNVIVDSSTAAKYSSGDPQRDGQWLKSILSGGCPGREIIAGFYSPTDDWHDSTLDPNDIELALVAFRETGALATWHEKNNPKLERKQPAPERTIDPEALRPFDKPAHVRAFVKALTETNTPVTRQRAVADRVLKALGEEPAKAKSGRDRHQGAKDSEFRFNATNIRSEVLKDALEKTRSATRKAELERIEHMTSLEKGLADLDAGLTRTLTGLKRMDKILALMGSVGKADMTVTAENHLDRIRTSMAAFQTFLAKRPVRRLLQIKGD